MLDRVARDRLQVAIAERIVARGAEILVAEVDARNPRVVGRKQPCAKIGLMNGDTIQAINGYDMSTPAIALEVYTKVRTASNLSVTVLRRGESKTLNYTIK